MGTFEKLNVQLRVEDMLNNILVCEERNPNYKFMVAEWLWIWFGLDDVQTIDRFNSNIKKFSDDGIKMAGAYGPRLVSQEPYVAKVLSNDRETRQAVFTIFSPSPQKSKDIPCTLSLQILVREGVVHATVNMRSSDIWLGLPYDFFTFSMFVNVFCSKFMKDCRLGSMTFNLASSHLYKTNMEDAERVIRRGYVESVRSPVLPFFPPGRLKSVLTNPNEKYYALEQPWHSYALVLLQSKHEALLRLKELAR